MEYHFGAMALEHLAHAPRILGVADHGDDLEGRAAVAELLLDRVERELRVLEEHEARRREARDLAAELRADGAAGAGDEHRAALQKRAQPGVVELDRIASQQVVELDLPQGRHADLA